MLNMIMMTWHYITIIIIIIIIGVAAIAVIRSRRCLVDIINIDIRWCITIDGH